jgi:hypothetical protein
LGVNFAKGIFGKRIFTCEQEESETVGELEAFVPVRLHEFGLVDKLSRSVLSEAD